MKNATILWILIIALVIVGGGWYLYSQNTPTNNASSNVGTIQTNSGTPGATDTTTSTSTDSTTAASVLTVSTSATLGAHLVAANGMTLYTYSPDTAGVSNCTGQCATNWPPYTVSADTQLAAVAGVSGAIATITREGGSMQVTYNGKPVYFYSKDTKVGDTNGQGVGGVWYVVTP